MRFQPLVAYYHLIQQRIEVSLGFIRHHTRTGSEFQSPFMDKLPDLAALGRILSEILFHEQAKVKNCKLTRSRGPTKVIKFHQSSQISPQSHQIPSKLSNFASIINAQLFLVVVPPYQNKRQKNPKCCLLLNLASRADVHSNKRLCT